MTRNYRALFNVPPGATPITTAREQLHAWLRSKNYRADELDDGRQVSLGSSVTGLAVSRTEQDGSRAWRCRVVENQPTGTWTTTLTAYETPGRGDDWLLLELDAPQGWTEWIGSHRIARFLVDSTEVLDGNGRLSTQPERMRTDDIPRLVGVLSDRQRRGLVYVAGTDSSLPTEKWFAYARDLLKDTVGVAASYLLDSQATEAFNSAVGPAHAVDGGTIRTFYPGPDFADPTDGRRHLILSTRTIVGRNKTRLSRNLGWRSRQIVLDHQLPTSLRRMTERLVADEDAIALRVEPVTIASVTTRPQTVAADPAHVDASVRPESRDPHPPGQFIGPEIAALAGADWRRAGSRLVRGLLGVQHPTPEHLVDVELLAFTAREHEARHAESIERLRASRAEAQRLDEDLAEVRQRLNDEQLEHQIDVDELRKLRYRTRELETLLRESDVAAQVFGVSTQDEVPESFEDLCILLAELEQIVFTGDESLTVGLDAHNRLGGWAAKTWDFLLEANDYAKAKKAGISHGDLHHHLSAPNGTRVSANQHARTESETVKNNAKWLRARVFPVPSEIDSRGEIEMLPHFKIAKFGMISPRLHYHDATGQDGKVYVGYIGPHLPSNQTN